VAITWPGAVLFSTQSTTSGEESRQCHPRCEISPVPVRRLLRRGQDGVKGNCKKYCLSLQSINTVCRLPSMLASTTLPHASRNWILISRRADSGRGYKIGSFKLTLTLERSK
jgi:hypothetical protein